MAIEEHHIMGGSGNAAAASFTKEEALNMEESTSAIGINKSALITTSKNKVLLNVTKNEEGKVISIKLPDNRFAVIKPIETPKWHGKTGKDSFTLGGSTEAFYDETTGGLGTGLSEEILNPNAPENKQVSERTFLESLTGQNLNSVFNRTKPHEFWGSKMGRLKLPYRTKILDLSKPYDYIHYKLATVNAMIAPSLQEYKDGYHHTATHYIYDENEINARKANKLTLKREAYALIQGTPEKPGLSENLQRRAVEVASGQTVRNKDFNAVMVLTDELIEANVEKFLEILKLDNTELNKQSTVIQYLSNGIIYDSGKGYYYEQVLLGYSVTEVVNFLSSSDNSEIRMKLKVKHENKI